MTQLLSIQTHRKRILNIKERGEGKEHTHELSKNLYVFGHRKYLNRSFEHRVKANQTRLISVNSQKKVG